MSIEKGLGTSRGVFGIFVLHKTMVWLSVYEDVVMQISLHYSLKITDFRGTTPTDSSPDMNLKQVFRY